MRAVTTITREVDGWIGPLRPLLFANNSTPVRVNDAGSG